MKRQKHGSERRRVPHPHLLKESPGVDIRVDDVFTPPQRFARPGPVGRAFLQYVREIPRPSATSGTHVRDRLCALMNPRCSDGHSLPLVEAEVFMRGDIGRQALSAPGVHSLLRELRFEHGRAVNPLAGHVIPEAFS